MHKSSACPETETMVYFLCSDYIHAAGAAEKGGGYGDSEAQQRVVYEAALKEIPL